MTLVALGDACREVTDGTHYSPLTQPSGIPFVTVKDVSNGTLDFSQCSRISQDDYAAAVRGGCAPEVGDVLFSKDGTVGKVHVVTSDQPFAVLSSIAILRPDPAKTDARYLAHVLRSPIVLDAAIRSRTGSAIRRVILSDLKRLVIYLPLLPQQRRIADILDRADVLRAKRQAALAQLDNLSQAIFLDMFGDPRTNPKQWRLSTVGESCLVVTDGEHQTPRRTSDGFKLLSARNVRDGYIDFVHVDYVPPDEYERIAKRCKPRRGDILISCSGTIGRVAAVNTDEPFALVRSAALVRPDTNLVLTGFLEQYLRTAYIRGKMLAASRASSQANLFQAQIRALPAIIPRLEVQERFTRTMRRVQEMSAGLASSERELDSLFSSLQNRAFRGEM